MPYLGGRQFSARFLGLGFTFCWLALSTFSSSLWTLISEEFICDSDTGGCLLLGCFTVFFQMHWLPAVFPFSPLVSRSLTVPLLSWCVISAFSVAWWGSPSLFVPSSGMLSLVCWLLSDSGLFRHSHLSPRTGYSVCPPSPSLSISVIEVVNICKGNEHL